MSKNDTSYVAPTVSDLTQSDVKEDVTKATEASTKQPTFKETKDVIGVKELSGSQPSKTTEIILERIQQHMSFLNGTVGYPTKEKQDNEQVTFIETIGNTLRLPYEQYVLVTNTLINQILENKELFNNGLAFRFTRGLDRKYPSEIISTYETYISFLTMIAMNWTSRYRLNKLIDLTYAINKLDKVGKENVTRYFNQLISN